MRLRGDTNKTSNRKTVSLINFTKIEGGKITMMNQGAALQIEREISVEDKLHIILEKAENGDLEAIALLEQINALTK